ncbi:MAG: PrsW family intramembrane metalloprotease [Nocardioidaceae bacterium]
MTAESSTVPVTWGPPPRRRQWSRTLLLVAMSLVCLVGASAVAWLAHRSGTRNGTALVLIFALIPLPVVVGCFLWLDRYEPEPLRYLLAAFAWGAVVAVAIALPLEVLVALSHDFKRTTQAAVWAPIIEESAKGLFLVAVLVRRRHRIDGVLDGVVYAGLVGAGFAFTENVGYYSGAYSGTLVDTMHGAGATTGLFIARGLMSPFAHSLFASAFGIGVGVAVAAQRRWLRWLTPPLGLAVGIGMHALWNGSAALGGGTKFLIVYGALFVPTFIGGVVGAVVLRTRQGKLVVRSLGDAARRGWLHPDEVPWLSTFELRRRARRFADKTAGRPAREALADYQDAATRLAFAHDSVLRGLVGSGGRLEVGRLLGELRLLRPHIVLPPPVRAWRPPPPPMIPYGWAPPPNGWAPPPSQAPAPWTPPVGVPGPPPGTPRD